MAIYLRYDKVREDRTEVEYRVQGAAEGSVLHLVIPKTDPSRAVLPEGMSPPPSGKVVGRAVLAARTEGSWPVGGLVQS